MEHAILITNLLLVALNGLLSALTWVTKSHLESYGQETGKQQAIEDNIEKLVEQMRVMTDAQKRIEATISHEMWGRQRTWELQREVAWEFSKCTGILATLHSRLTSINDMVPPQGLPSPAREKTMAEITEIDSKVNETMESLWGLEGMTYLVFGEKMAAGVQDLTTSAMAWMASIHSDDEEIRNEAQRLYILHRAELIRMFKKNLDEGIEALVPTQS